MTRFVSIAGTVLCAVLAVAGAAGAATFAYVSNSEDGLFLKAFSDGHAHYIIAKLPPEILPPSVAVSVSATS